MSRIISVDGKELAFGLLWLTLDAGKGEKAAIKKAVKEHSAKYRARVAGPEHIAIGLMTEEPDLPKKPKANTLLSAAALFATRQQAEANCLLALRLPGTQYSAMVVVLGGVLYLDSVIMHTRLGDRISSLYAETGANFKIFSDDLASFPNATAITPSDLLGGDQKKAALESTSSVAGIIALSALTLIVGVGYFAWDEYERDRKRREMEALAAQQPPPVPPAELYQRELDAQMKALGIAPRAWKQVALPVIGRRDTTQGGWKLIEVRCDDGGACVEQWNQDFGTNHSFASKETFGQPQFSLAGTTLSNTYTLKLEKGAANTDALPHYKDFVIDFGSLIQQTRPIGLQITADEPTTFALPPGIPAEAIPADKIVSRGSLSVTGPIGMLPGMLEKLPANVFLGELTVRPQGGTAGTFVIQGAYYVKQ